MTGATGTPASLLANLESRGVRLWPEAGGVHYRPARSIPPDLRAAIVAHKPALLELLAAWDGPAADRLAFLADGEVARCGGCGDDPGIRAEAERFLAAWLARDMAGVRRACALVEERARQLAGGDGRSAA